MQAGLEVWGQMLWGEHSMSVVVFKSSEERWLSVGSEVESMEEMCEGKWERRLQRKKIEGGDVANPHAWDGVPRIKSLMIFPYIYSIHFCT